jgi:hypothetical protein
MAWAGKAKQGNSEQFKAGVAKQSQAEQFRAGN